MLSLDQLSLINHDESGTIDLDAYNYYELMSNQEEDRTFHQIGARLTR